MAELLETNMESSLSI